VGVKNLDLPTDFTLLPLTTGNAGLQSGDPLPPFVTWAFQYIRTRTDVHHGWKRLAGGTEAEQAGGTAASGTLTYLDAIATAMEATLASVFEPRIMRKKFDTLTSSWVYTDFPISGVNYVRISTQNTRKFGRGA
jgi:hypothetical protein